MPEILQHDLRKRAHKEEENWTRLCQIALCSIESAGILLSSRLKYLYMCQVDCERLLFFDLNVKKRPQKRNWKH